jgi:hypothetical protein
VTVSLRSVQGGLAVALFVIGSGCEINLDVGKPNHIDHIRVLGFRIEVVELAPIWPERVSLDPDDAPIVEALPGDRVQLSAMVVGADGRALPAEDFDAIWLQCAGDSCAGDLPACQDIEWTNESACRLGRGGVLEFVAPPPGPSLPDAVGYMGIVANDEGADAEVCRQGLVAGTTALSKCTIVVGAGLMGPRWPMLHDAVMAGMDIGMPITEIPAAAFGQAANRAPAPGASSWFDLESDEPLEGSPLRVHAGQQVVTKGPMWRSADHQSFVVAEAVIEHESYVFVDAVERVNLLYFTSGPLRSIERDGDRVVIEVEEFADPGIAGVILVVGDNRLGLDFHFVEFEVVP